MLARRPATSCAHWLSWQCGLGAGAAREHVRVARAQRRVPLTAAAFLDGRTSYAKARALTRVADTATEGTLLGFAVTVTAARTEGPCGRRGAPTGFDEATVSERRRFDYWWDDDGMLVPDGEPPDLPETLEAGGERMDLAWAARVPVGNRDVARRMAAELGSVARPDARDVAAGTSALPAPDPGGVDARAAAAYGLLSAHYASARPGRERRRCG